MVQSTSRTLSKIMSSVAKIVHYFKKLNTSRMFEKTGTLGMDECWLRSFEFLQTFMDVSLLKRGKESCTFFHEMSFGNIFPFSVFR